MPVECPGFYDYRAKLVADTEYNIRAINPPISYYSSVSGNASVIALASVPVLPDGSTAFLEDFRPRLFIWTPPSSIVGKNVTILFQGPAIGVLHATSVKPSPRSPIMSVDYDSMVHRAGTALLTLEPCMALPNGSFYIAVTWVGTDSVKNATFSVATSIADLTTPPTAADGSVVFSPAALDQKSIYRLPFNVSAARSLVLINYPGANAVISNQIGLAKTGGCQVPQVTVTSSAILFCKLVNVSAFSESDTLYLQSNQASYQLSSTFITPVRASGAYIPVPATPGPQYIFFGNDPADYPMKVVVTTGRPTGGVGLKVTFIDLDKPFCTGSVEALHPSRNYTYVLTCPKALALNVEYGTVSDFQVVASKIAETSSMPVVSGGQISTFVYRPDVLYTATNPSNLGLSCIGPAIDGVSLVVFPFTDGSCGRTTIKKEYLCQNYGNVDPSPVGSTAVYGAPGASMQNSVTLSPFSVTATVNYTFVPATACVAPEYQTPVLGFCQSVIQYPLASTGEILPSGTYTWQKDLELMTSSHPELTEGSSCYEAVRRFSCWSTIPQCEPTTGTLIRFPEVCRCDAVLAAACPTAHPYLLRSLCARTASSTLCGSTAEPPAPVPFQQATSAPSRSPFAQGSPTASTAPSFAAGPGFPFPPGTLGSQTPGSTNGLSSANSLSSSAILAACALVAAVVVLFA